MEEDTGHDNDLDESSDGVSDNRGFRPWCESSESDAEPMKERALSTYSDSSSSESDMDPVVAEQPDAMKQRLLVAAAAAAVAAGKAETDYEAVQSGSPNIQRQERKKQESGSHDGDNNSINPRLSDCGNSIVADNIGSGSVPVQLAGVQHGNIFQHSSGAAGAVSPQNVIIYKKGNTDRHFSHHIDRSFIKRDIKKE